MKTNEPTAAQLLARCKALDIVLHVEDGRLRYRGRGDDLTPELSARIADHESELVELLTRGSTCPACGSARIAPGLRRLWCIDCETDIGPAGDPQDLTEGDGAMVADDRQTQAHGSAPVPIEWPAAAADFCLRLAPGDLPPVPFKLNAWTTVSDAARFLRSLRADILRGPSGPRAFYGALQAELIELQQFAHRGQKGR